jgi:hypothetical protein
LIHAKILVEIIKIPIKAGEWMDSIWELACNTAKVGQLFIWAIYSAYNNREHQLKINTVEGIKIRADRLTAHYKKANRPVGTGRLYR